MVPADKDDEKSLITLACEGNGLATHTLYRLHVRYLTAICSRYVANKEDVKDVLQSSFLKIFTSLDSFEYRGTGSLRAWMVRVVVNESLRFMKSQSRLTFEELPEQYNASDEEPDTSDIPTAMIHEHSRQNKGYCPSMPHSQSSDQHRVQYLKEESTGLLSKQVDKQAMLSQHHPEQYCCRST